MFKCKKCGGTNVQDREWVRTNTQEVIPDGYAMEDNDTWCEDCEEHTGIEWVEENVCEQCEQNPCICDVIYSPNAG